MASFEIFADEAWTHGGGELNRYWCFFGGILGLSNDLDRLETDLRKIKAAEGIGGEVKWSNLTAVNLLGYKKLIDCLFDHLRGRDIKYRQMFVDRALVRVPDSLEEPLSDLDVQFKLYYQFLKHAFGIKYLPPSAPEPQHQL